MKTSKPARTRALPGSQKLPVAYTSWSLFAGAGGLDISIDPAGFKTSCSLKSGLHYTASMQRNTRSKAIRQADARISVVAAPL